MARIGYCRHGTYTGQWPDTVACHLCEAEDKEAKIREEGRINEIRRIVREELMDLGLIPRR